MITNLKENDIIMCIVPYKVYDDYDLFLNPLIVKDIISEPNDSYIKEVVLEYVSLLHKPMYGHYTVIDTCIIPFSHIQEYFKKINMEEIL
jgi:hypothetical protein